MNKRGVVVSNPIAIDGSRLEMNGTRIDEQLLRYYLLFFDEINFPSNPIMNIGLTQDEEFLLGAGILRRERVDGAPAGGLAEGFAYAHLAAFRALEDREPGVWGLATGPRSIDFLDSELLQGRGLLVHLYKAIPVPSSEVPIQDILDFRVKRSDELIALRVYIEELYQKILLAGDGDLALQTNLTRLHASLQDYRKSMSFRSGTFNLFSTSASLNLVAAGTGLYTASQAGWSTEGIALGALSALSIELAPALMRRRAPNPFKYVVSYEKELFPPPT